MSAAGAIIMAKQTDELPIATRRWVDFAMLTPGTSQDAIRGGQQTVIITRQEQCRTCHGAGQLHVSESRCAQCTGTGVVKSARGHMVFSKPCAHCAGLGTQAETRCPSCAGRARAW